MSESSISIKKIKGNSSSARKRLDSFNKVIIFSFVALLRWGAWIVSKFYFIPGLHLAAESLHSLFKLYRVWNKKSGGWRVVAMTVILINLALVAAALIGTIMLGFFAVAPILLTTAASMGGFMSLVKLAKQINKAIKDPDWFSNGDGKRKIFTSSINAVFTLSITVTLGIFFFVPIPPVHAVAGIVLIALGIGALLFQAGKNIYKKYKAHKANGLVDQAENDNLLIEKEIDNKGKRTAASHSSDHAENHEQQDTEYVEPSYVTNKNAFDKKDNNSEIPSDTTNANNCEEIDSKDVSMDSNLKEVQKEKIEAIAEENNEFSKEHKRLPRLKNVSVDVTKFIARNLRKSMPIILNENKYNAIVSERGKELADKNGQHFKNHCN